MPQITSRPPPYSIECSSFPPPLQAAAGPHTWAFQRAFEAAREPVRWAILTTMRCWTNEWAYKGSDVPRNSIQRAYDDAPHDLKATLDYIVEYKVPFYMKDDCDRRCYHLYRTGRVEEIKTSMMSEEGFLRHYDEATDIAREAVSETFGFWATIEELQPQPTPAAHEIAQAYAAASDPLRIVASWILETGWPVCIWNKLAFEQAKTIVHERCLGQATAHIELHAKNRLEGMY